MTISRQPLVPLITHAEKSDETGKAYAVEAGYVLVETTDEVICLAHASVME